MNKYLVSYAYLDNRNYLRLADAVVDDEAINEEMVSRVKKTLAYKHISTIAIIAITKLETP